MNQIDTATLYTIINAIYSMAGDVTCPNDVAADLNTLAQTLKKYYDKLLGAQFNAGTQAYVDSTNAIVAVNTTLANQAQALAQSAATIAQITNLANVLDGLLKLIV